MAPITPYTCEELWEAMGHKDYISVAEYPVSDPKKIDPVVDAKENMIKNLMEDIQHILDISKIKPERIHIYLAPEWKRKAFALLRSCTPMKQIMNDVEMKPYGKEISQIMQKYRRDEIPELMLTLDEEYDKLKDAQKFLEKEFNAEIDIQKTPTKDPENKARFAIPQKPGIYIK
jgi:leucyl-tRNA synthetase